MLHPPPTTLDDRIRAKIKGWVATTGITQRTLAARLGRSQSWVSRYLDGEQKADLDTLAKIADVFGHSFSALLESPQNPADAALIELYRSLPAPARQALLTLLQQIAGTRRRPAR